VSCREKEKFFGQVATIIELGEPQHQGKSTAKTKTSTPVCPLIAANCAANAPAIVCWQEDKDKGKALRRRRLEVGFANEDAIDWNYPGQRWRRSASSG